MTHHSTGGTCRCHHLLSSQKDQLQLALGSGRHFESKRLEEVLVSFANREFTLMFYLIQLKGIDIGKATISIKFS